MLISFTPLATTALGFTVAIAWNDAVSKTFKSLFPPQNEKTAARMTLIYALIITILVIIIVAVINHTRKVVHKISGGGNNGGNGGGNNSGNGSNGGGTGAQKQCKECTGCGHCYPQGFSSIIHLWDPSMGTA